MTVKERLLAIRLAEKLAASDLAREMNIEIRFVKKTDERAGEKLNVKEIRNDPDD